jgi:hypothetical protein
LADHRTAKSSLEQRGVGVVTTAGVLVTVLFGLSAVVTKRGDFHLPSAAAPWLYAALGLFVVAAAGGLVAALPYVYKAPRTEALDRLVREKWDNSAWAARRKVALAQIDLIAVYRRNNRRKAIFLGGGILAELLAMAMLAVTVGLLISHGLA